MPRIIIVGAGPAGTRAAATLVARGERPVLIDESPASGGQIYRRVPSGFRRTYKTLYGLEAGKAKRLHEEFDSLEDSVDYYPASTVWAVDAGKIYFVRQEDGARVNLPYDRLIVATGAMDRVIPLPGWTTPGVFTLGAAQIALKYQGCAIGAPTVLMGTGPLLYLLAYQYVCAGVPLAGVLDTTPMATALRGLPSLFYASSAAFKGLYFAAVLHAKGITVERGVTPVEIVSGDDGKQVVGVAYLDKNGVTKRIACTAVALGYGLQSETQLADLAQCEFKLDSLSRQWLPVTDSMGRSTVSGVYLCGDGARVRGADYAEAGGELAALAAMLDMGKEVPAERIVQLQRTMARGTAFSTTLQRVFPVPHHLVASLPQDTVVCRCENVTLEQVVGSTGVGPSREINRTKALVRIGMGRCQGRCCGLTAVSALHTRCGVPLEDAGRIRGQAPVKPLAGAVPAFCAASSTLSASLADPSHVLAQSDEEPQSVIDTPFLPGAHL